MRDHVPLILRLAASFLLKALPSLGADVSLTPAPRPEKEGGAYTTSGSVHKQSLSSRDREEKEEAQAQRPESVMGAWG